jgi:multidrug efflux system membrane fusion protein
MDQESRSTAASEPRPHASDPNSGLKRRRWVGWVIALLVVVLAIAAIHHHQKKKQSAKDATPAPTPVTVRGVTAKLGDIAVYLDAIGTVTPVYTDSITVQATGVITAVHYHEGQIVKKGDPLIDLDAHPYLAQLGEAKGTLEHDESVLAQAKMDLARYKEAWSGNGISRQQFEDQEKAVLQEQGTVNYDRSAVQYAQVQLNYCHIVAPISGRVGLRLVDPGNLVTANATTTLVVITQLRPITVVFTLAQDDVATVLKEMHGSAPLTVEAYDRVQQQLLGTGKLISIDNQIDTTTGTVKLRASYDNADNALFANQFVNTRLLLRTLHNQVLIPDGAIQHNGETAFAYVLEQGKAVMRVIRPGVTNRGTTAVEGIRPGEVVADSSFEKLQDGTQVAFTNSVLPTGSSSASEGGQK